MRPLVVQELETPLRPLYKAAVEFHHDELPADHADFLERNARTHDALVHLRRLEHDFVQHFLKRVKLAVYRDCTRDIAVKRPEPHTKVKEHKFAIAQRFVVLHVMQAAGILAARNDRRESEVAIATALHLVVEEQRHIALGLHVLHLGQKRSESLVRNLLRHAGIGDTFRFQHQAVFEVHVGTAFDAQLIAAENLLQIVLELFVVVALELLVIERISMVHRILAVRILFRKRLDEIPKLVNRQDILYASQAGNNIFALYKAKAFAVPEFLERVLTRHKKRRTQSARVKHQIAARLIHARQVQKRRVLHKTRPGLNKGFLAPRFNGHPGKNTKRIHFFHQGQTPFRINFLGIVIFGRQKDLRVGLSVIFS